MKEEMEFVSHPEANYNIFLVNMLYRTPHLHRDFEICLLLEGEIILLTQGQKFHYRTNDIWILNPFESHELKASEPARILTLQFSPSLFHSYFPPIEKIRFQLPDYDCTEFIPKENKEILIQILLNMAHVFFKKENTFQLRTVGLIYLVFDYLLTCFPYTTVSEKEKLISYNKAMRLQDISNYIDVHYSEKLLLGDLAEKQGLTMSYLSHFFKDNFGMPFQEYLNRIRCEKARQLLLLTNHSLLDISLSCGFSDPKYFNRGFSRQYGCSPKEYRVRFEHDELPQQQKSMLTTQQFLSQEASLITLDRFFNTGSPKVLFYT